LRNYYYNCIRDCDRQVVAVLDALKQAGADKNTIVVFSADHGELGGNHQMRGKGNCAYRQQNHVPLMIVHPAYPGGLQCRAVTSQIDLLPTLLALTGAPDEQLQKVGVGLQGRDFSPLLTAPVDAAVDSLRPAALFNYNMWAYQDYTWSEKMLPTTMAKGVPAAEKIQELLRVEPNFQNRCAIRSVYDGRYRFSRYFGQTDFNRPTTWEELTSNNDIELYDLETDSRGDRQPGHGPAAPRRSRHDDEREAQRANRRRGGRRRRQLPAAARRQVVLPESAGSLVVRF
jgi:arylsulfatase A-like enzyme